MILLSMSTVFATRAADEVMKLVRFEDSLESKDDHRMAANRADVFVVGWHQKACFPEALVLNW